MTDQKNVNITKNATVTLRQITKENLGWILKLKVAPEQEKFVASNAVSIAEAYFDREIAWFRAIYADETPVGFLMLSDDSSMPEYFLWRLMVDARYQKFGFARQAMALLFEYIKTRPEAKEIFNSCVPDEEGLCGFYEKLGFAPTGDIEDGEVVLRREL
jgi:diamine N-acetyltransferase